VSARRTDAGLELIEQVGVVIVDGIDETGDEEVVLGVGLGEESRAERLGE
jgi:hypothetical protein